MIELECVSKVYPTRRGPVRALDELSLDVAAGQFLAVRGPSGCGKSTFLSLVGGLARPTSGRVSVAGRELAAMSGAERSRFRAEKIGFVFQMFHLLPYLSVLENVLVAAHGGRRDGTSESARQLLERFGLQSRSDHRPSQLSAGERQRVALARALLNEPEVLLADEPTGNLDPDNAATVLDAISAIHRGGTTVVLVTHDDRAAQRAEQTIYLDAGRLSTHGSQRVAETH